MLCGSTPSASDRDHELAAALWKTGCYEARLLAARLSMNPSSFTPAQMDRWAKDFDNWAVCDTLYFTCSIARRTPSESRALLSSSPAEFVKRAAFALLWSTHGARSSVR